MRPLVPAVIALTLLVTAATSPALTLEQGKILRGPYDLNGYARAIGFQSNFGPARVRVTVNGRLRGKVLRTQQFGGVVSRTYVNVSGKIRTMKIRARKGTFTAPAVIRLGTGARFVGEFNGLISPDQKPSRYFRGKVAGAKRSNLILRSR